MTAHAAKRSWRRMPPSWPEAKVRASSGRSMPAWGGSTKAMRCCSPTPRRS
jgi:hypothetical protein